VVFQLLNFGIHPYTGRPNSDAVPTDIPSRIAGRYYAYGLQPNASLAPSPVSGHRCFPAELRALFDRAFAGSTATRPAASEWLIALRGYAQRSRQQLVVCAVDPAHQHFVGLPCAACTRAALVTQTAKRQAAVRAAAPIPVVGVRQTIGWRMTRPVAPAGVRPRRGWPTRGTTTNFPLPLPTSFATGPSPKPVFNWIKVALYVVFFLFVVFNKTHKPTPTPDSHPTQSQQAAAPDADNPNFNPENRACFHAGNPLESGPGRLASVAASSAVSRQNQPLKLAFYSLMQSATGTSGPTVPPSQRAQFTQYVDSQLYDDFNTRELLINSTENDLHDQNRDAETAYERGWLALADRQPDVAIESFVCAIEIDPRLPESWYGLAVASEDPMLATGFMTISNLLAPGDAYRQAVRAQFNPRLLDRIYRDHDSMATVDTNAEGHAQRIRADRVVLPMSPSAASR
jgi:hypothetical protein